MPEQTKKKICMTDNTSYMIEFYKSQYKKMVINKNDFCLFLFDLFGQRIWLSPWINENDMEMESLFCLNFTVKKGVTFSIFNIWKKCCHISYICLWMKQRDCLT